jgi:hypothetical protein
VALMLAMMGASAAVREAELLEGERDGRKKLPLKTPICALPEVVFGANDV